MPQIIDDEKQHGVWTLKVRFTCGDGKTSFFGTATTSFLVETWLEDGEGLAVSNVISTEHKVKWTDSGATTILETGDLKEIYVGSSTSLSCEIQMGNPVPQPDGTIKISGTMKAKAFTNSTPTSISISAWHWCRPKKLK